MNSKDYEFYIQLKEKGLTKSQEEKIKKELEFTLNPLIDSEIFFQNPFPNIYSMGDSILHTPEYRAPHVALETLDRLLKRDKQREKDGFPKKIKFGKMVKPSKDKSKVVIVPDTIEEKFYHEENFLEQDDSGTGKGEEGEVIGEMPINQKGEGQGAGEGEGGIHEIVADAYKLGKILTEEFKLPNLKDKGKKRSLTKYTYELNDLNRGAGQILNKSRSLKNILKTNLAIGRIDPEKKIDPSDLIISPQDKVYNTFSKEKDFESQALVFFLRDYSGSMNGAPTDIVVNQHLFIYSWLMFQYKSRVESRFILHDTSAKEVPDFYTYYNSSVAGGTHVASAFQLTNEIVSKENLAKDYNIYVFHGTDGDDWKEDGKETIEEIKTMLGYSSRVGITIAENGWNKPGNTTVQKYLKKSGLLKGKSNLLRLDTMVAESASEERIVNGIKKLLS